MNTPKLRVIQSNSNGFVSQLGDLCYSGLKSFSEENPRESRLTLFILKNEDGTKNVSVFESVFSGEKNTEGQYIFVTVTTPVTVRNVNTNVHLMSSLSDKMELVDSVLWVILKGVYITPHSYTPHYYNHTMELTQTHQEILTQVEKLITDKYEEQLWEECYYPEENHVIRELLGQLQRFGVEVTFSVKLTPYDNTLWYTLSNTQTPLQLVIT